MTDSAIATSGSCWSWVIDEFDLGGACARAIRPLEVHPYNELVCPRQQRVGGQQSYATADGVLRHDPILVPMCRRRNGLRADVVVIRLTRRAEELRMSRHVGDDEG